eukprot:5798788-Amphidinium_carterae.2
MVSSFQDGSLRRPPFWYSRNLLSFDEVCHIVITLCRQATAPCSCSSQGVHLVICRACIATAKGHPCPDLSTNTGAVSITCLEFQDCWGKNCCGVVSDVLLVDRLEKVDH